MYIEKRYVDWSTINYQPTQANREIPVYQTVDIDEQKKTQLHLSRSIGYRATQPFPKSRDATLSMCS